MVSILAYLFTFYRWLYFIFVKEDLSECVFLRGESSEETQLSTGPVRGSQKNKWYMVIAKKPYNLIVSRVVLYFFLSLSLCLSLSLSLQKLSVMAMFGILTAWHATGTTAHQGFPCFSPQPRQANLDEHFREANKIIQDSRFR